MRATAVLGLLLLTSSTSVAGEPHPDVPWESLTNGVDLTGWHIAPLNGKAPFAWRDGEVVGTTVQGEPITYLCTDRMYGDFVLECEFMIPEGMNAGIQFRSHTFPEYRDGGFFGYQYELSASPGPHDHRWTGGIFDEVRRGWIGPVVNRTVSENPLRPGDWNEARIVACGGRIKTWLNGVPITELDDTLTPAGYIALQLHDTQKRSGVEIRWRNLRVKDVDRHASRHDDLLGWWKGATSNAGDGLYARVERRGEDYIATVYDAPREGGNPLARLVGRREGSALELAANGWTARIENGVLRGTGFARQVNIDRAAIERTDARVPIRFELMPGVFNAE